MTEHIDPDLDPDCNWDGNRGGRSIRHIMGCTVCASIWPQIAQDPAGAIAELVRMQEALWPPKD